ncbi:MAG: transketolase [Gammaproteobacteria bacterium]|nr:transketolase [Gammaproteobacteria bacterium]
MDNHKELANAIRALSMDAVQQAKSGHPGAPMGMADIAEVLWRKYLKHNPKDPNWMDRDRFVLSNGHGSMLIYSLLHLTGYDLSMQDIKDFRQLHSKTPGHPEVGEAPGVETTTGPLGQGLANAVGMALAERMLAAQFNQKDRDIIDHFTYVFAGDGCLMEGISHEACSLAGTLKLGKLIVFYDDNGISIDGEVQDWFTEDIPQRFESYGWQVIRGIDGHDAVAIDQAIQQAQGNTSQPTLIDCKTIIGFGSPNKEGTSGVHGAPLGAEEIQLVRDRIGWKHGPFEIPEDIYNAWSCVDSGTQKQQAWEKKFASYQSTHPELAKELLRRYNGVLPDNWATDSEKALQAINEKAESVATRKASELALEAVGPLLPELIGGSADLTGSNNTWWSGSKSVLGDDVSGNYIYYGVREFGMSAMMNGMALHGGFIPYSGTFLTFSDYARNAVRMAALMNTPSLFVYTHDSIGLGEDGPTHQSIEHISSLRSIPNLMVWRPCDTVESMVAWRTSIELKHPAALAFSRQGVPFMTRNKEQLGKVEKGAYVLFENNAEPELIILATGTEVGISMDAAKQLDADGVKVRLVSMPSADVFELQDDAYKQSVLPNNIRARIAVEAGVTDFWRKYVGLDGDVVGIDQFGASAPGSILMEHFGFTAENIAKRARALL